MYESKNALDEISLDGFQVVNAELFSHPLRCPCPTCTVWPGKISFNAVAIKALNNCEFVRIEVNPQTKGILVVPVPSHDKDSIRWTRGSTDTTPRSMESKPFSEKLYSAWNLDSNLVYRSCGRLVSSKSKVMLLFDFNSAEHWNARRADSADV